MYILNLIDYFDILNKNNINYALIKVDVPYNPKKISKTLCDM